MHFACSQPAPRQTKPGTHKPSSSQISTKNTAGRSRRQLAYLPRPAIRWVPAADTCRTPREAWSAIVARNGPPNGPNRLSKVVIANSVKRRQNSNTQTPPWEGLIRSQEYYGPWTYHNLNISLCF